MRAYSPLDEEVLRTRDLLKDWAGEGLLTEAQYHLMEQETVCNLRRTNVFLRIVLFIFTLIVTAAAAGLFFSVVAPGSGVVSGVFLLILAAVSYGLAEYSVCEAKFYRYGIEEALALCSVGFLCSGIYSVFYRANGSAQSAADFVTPIAGMISALWIWYRFGLPYASAIALIFAIWLPGYWTASPSEEHVTIAAIYAAGLIAIVLVRPRYRATYLNESYSIFEALLWFGIYLAINLRLSSLKLLGDWSAVSQAPPQFPPTFYWTTWLLIFCLPPLVLWRGLLQKDRFVIATGGIVAVLTLITNKPYLGWPRHTWDPMLMGILLVAVALAINRWLSRAPEGIRHGFTAKRLSGKDKQWLNAGATALGFAAPHLTAAHPQTPRVQFEGGDSAGGGATSDF